MINYVICAEMEMESIISEIKQKKFRPVYILHGEESYFTERITEAIIDNALNPEEREFNQTILYGRDTDVKDLVSAIKRFPMMSPYHVIVLREAQDLKKVEELEPILTNPIDTSILVLAFKKKVDMRKKWIKSLRKDCINFSSNKVPDWKLSDWVSKESRRKGLEVDSKSASMIAEFVGGDLQRIDKDLDKLKMMTEQGHSDKEIAEQLTNAGHRSPRADKVLESTVRNVRLKKGILRVAYQSHPRQVDGSFTITQMAKKLGVSRWWITNRIKNGTIQIEKDEKAKCYLFPDTPEMLAVLKSLVTEYQTKTGCLRGHQDD